jgi:FecR protein
MAEGPRDEVLRRVVREARSDGVPELDWDELETSLMRRVRSNESARASSVSWRPLAVFGVAVAGAALAIGLYLNRPPPAAQLASAPSPTSSDSTRDGDALSLGVAVDAHDTPVRVRHRGRAYWTLGAHSTAKLVERSERLTVRLEAGSVVAEVVPSLGPDSFAIEVGQARVSVHGTVFKVELKGDRIRVAVTEGTVAVGARGSTLAPSFVLEAGAQGDFALDGRTGQVNKAERPSAAPAQRAKSSTPTAKEPTPAEPETAASAVPTALPAEPSIADIESGVMELVNVAGSCFTRHTAPGDGVEVTVRTAVTLQIGPDGLVSELEFSPPLSPAVEACAESGIRQLGFARSTEGVKVTRLLELKR